MSEIEFTSGNARSYLNAFINFFRQFTHSLFPLTASFIFFLAPHPGFAGDAVLKSDPAGREADVYLLEWTVVSHSPGTAFNVQYRQEGLTAWTSANAEPNQDGPYHYAGKLYLKELTGATRYQARVTSRNEEGWNKWPEQHFHFATHGAGLCLL